MLESFTLKNFKSFKETILSLTPTVTFLIGANASGKSNALEALKLFNFFGKGKSLKEFESEVNSDHSPIRCPVREMFYEFDTKLFEMGCIIDNDTDQYEFSIGIGQSQGKQLEFKQESLVCGKEKKIVYSTEDKSLKEQSINNFINFVKQTYSNNGKALFWGLKALLELIDKKTISLDEQELFVLISKGTEQVCHLFSSIFFLEPEPCRMRSYKQQIEGMSLSETGDNLSSVLDELCRNEKIKIDILEMIRSLPEQEILDINFSRTDENFLMFRLEESLGNKHLTTPAYSLSDGTLRALAIATALFSVPEGSLLVIEEVDNGIHPSRIKHLVDKMYEIAAKRKIQILATTHDPAMMDAIPSQEKGNVLCCYRDKKDGCSKIVRLSDTPQYIDILTNGRLGSLVATSKFDDFIKKTPEERQKEHDAWVEQYKNEQDEYHKALKKALGEE